MAGQRPFTALWLVVAAALGAGLALGGAALAGGLGGKTTTVHEIGAASASAPAIRPAASLSISDIYRRSSPGVVRVASGSGFVIDKAGHVVTNQHVVAGARQIRVGFSNGTSVPATLVGTDASSDLAVLRIDASPRALTPLQLGNSDTCVAGEPVVALGNPLGLERTVTHGIVSAIQREVTAPNGYTIDRVIRTDAPIGHRDSGGPLLNGAGEVIGVNSESGYAIPSNTVKTVIAQLIRRGHIDRAFVGIGAVPITRELARVFRLPVARGLLVQSVQPGSGASRAGLRPGTTQVVLAGESYNLGGDIVVSADEQRLAGLNKLRDLVAAKKPGDTIALVVYRNAKKTTLHVKLGRQPGSTTG